MKSIDLSRRSILKHSLLAMSAFMGNILLPTSMQAALLRLASTEELLAPDENGVRLPAGFHSRIVVRSGQILFNYQWHAAPDGGAIFATEDAGWIYVSNSELDHNAGGVGALRFDHSGKLIDAYSILNNTNRNCAGGHTPWQTWLSCEEIAKGRVWECDPFGKKEGQVRAALGLFRHEAVAVDTINKQIYLTEDETDGCLYRYTARSFNTTQSHPNLDDGFLEVAEVFEGSVGKVRWHVLPDSLAQSTWTRHQVDNATHFNGGEGIWYHRGIIYFVTKGDNRVWMYDIPQQELSIIYSSSQYRSPVLTGVDNIIANQAGELLIAEDGGDMQIVVLVANKVFPLLQLVGHERSEIAGPALSPDGKRLYFSSQRGSSGYNDGGITYEVTGPF
ncbi:MAG: alkaline phosphatase PhoX [Nitrosomonas sp.]